MCHIVTLTVFNQDTKNNDSVICTWRAYCNLILMFLMNPLRWFPQKKCIPLLCNYYHYWHNRILKGECLSFNFFIFRPISKQCLIDVLHNIICYLISKRGKKVANIRKFRIFRRYIELVSSNFEAFSLSTGFIFLLRVWR